MNSAARLENLSHLQSVEFNLRAIKILGDICFDNFDNGRMTAEDFIFLMRFLVRVTNLNTFNLRHYLMDYQILIDKEN